MPRSTLFPTTAEQRLRLPVLVVDMLSAGLDRDLVTRWSELARVDQGVFELFELWAESEADPEERALIVADIQDLLDAQSRPISVWSLATE